MTLSARPEMCVLQVEEMKPLLEAHWHEIGIYKDRMPLDIDLEHYKLIEDAKQLIYVALRDAGKLVGYFVGFVSPALHYRSTLTCRMDICYVSPPYRRTGGGTVLFDAVQKELRRRGVKLWWVGSKDHSPIEGFYESLGFERQETYFTMWLGDDDGA